MKRFFTYLILPVLTLAASCAKTEPIDYAHEQQAFKTLSDKILLEVIMPQASASTDEIYIVGAFNGGEAAIGNASYLMTHSETITSKWGIYLDPAQFQGGKTLADGFTFYNVEQGYERSSRNEAVSHKLTIGPGQWANVYADKWEKYFLPVDPDEGKIVLPEHDGVRIYIIDQTGWDAIALYQWGDVNNLGGEWPGAPVSGTWTANGQEYKYFEYGDDIFGLAQNLIFNNNGNGTQLADYNVTFTEGVQDYFFQVTADGATLLDGPGGGGSVDPGPGPEPQPEQPKEDVVVFVQDLSGWDELALYTWGDKNVAGEDLCGDWPGIAPAGTQKVGTVVYKVFELKDALGRSENLIFNNNGAGSQTGDLALILEEVQFVQLADDGEGTIVATVIDPTSPDIKILINNKTDWDEVALYAWGDAEAFGAWPGATPVTTEVVKGVEYLVFGLPADMAGKSLNLIFNNNNKGKQLEGFAITVPEEELFLTINAAYSLGPVEGNPRGEASTIYVVNKQGWETLNLYAWGDAEVFGGWTGAAGNKIGTWCGAPVYTFDVAADASGKSENLIFNNGEGAQFDALSTTLGEDLFLEIENSACIETTPATRVYVIDETGWDEIALYVWGTSEIFGGWPGAAPAGTQEIGGVTYKYFEVPAAAFGNTANFILNNNGNGVQLENFDILKGQTIKTDFYFRFTADNVTVVE